MQRKIERTKWGGIADRRFQPSGRFRVEREAGVCWLVDPDGGRFLSKGVNTVCFDQDRIGDTDCIPYAETCRRKYGDVAAWRVAAAERLSGWGFNTLGSWSDEVVAQAGTRPLAVTPNLDLGASFAWERNERRDGNGTQHFPDVFDPAFADHVARRARARCSPHAGEPHILGWFIDNELRWGPDWRGADELLTLFLNLPPASSGRMAALAWLGARHRDFDAFDAVWRLQAASWDALADGRPIAPPYRRDPPYQRDAMREAAAERADPRRAAFTADCDAFCAHVAERYFALTADAIRAADPGHLVLGSRFAYPPFAGVIAAAARHVDVLSFNCYDPGPERAMAAYAAAAGDTPWLIGEFSFRAADSGLPNTRGAGPVVASQAERAACFRNYVAAALGQPALVGYHWFEHADQPAEGRFDGENSNYGTVTIDDAVYPELTEAMAQVNASAEDVHAAATAVA